MPDTDGTGTGTRHDDGPDPSGSEPAGRRPGARLPLWALAAALLAVIAAVLAALAVLAGGALPERPGPPVEELAVERTVLQPGTIELTVRNTGPDPVQIAQVFVNDSFVDVAGGAEPITRLGTATVRLDYPWQDGQPYLVTLLTSTGVAVEHEIPAAVATPSPADGDVVGVMALLGTYVGIVPVALGMLALPLLRRVGPTTVRVLLALTAGLLAYLALDAGIDAVELAAGSGRAYGGPALVFLGAGLAYLALTTVDHLLRRRAHRVDTGGTGGLRLAAMIATGIGLHNLGEGLAIGSAYAVGELALGASLVVGFALHNTTEGIAVVTPLADRGASLTRLGGLGLLAGAPAVLGAVLGAAVYNVELSAFLLGIGIGAIVQVVVQLAPALRAPSGPALSPATIGGVAAGLVIMYLTGLLVSV